MAQSGVAMNVLACFTSGAGRSMRALLVACGLRQKGQSWEAKDSQQSCGEKLCTH
jgi:hypothetical protein